MIAKRSVKRRNDDRKAYRLSTAVTSAIVSDDESDEGDDLDQNTYDAIQAYITVNEPTKPSRLRVLSKGSLAPSPTSSLFLTPRQKVARRVSIATDSQFRVSCFHHH